MVGEDVERIDWDELLPSRAAGPDAVFARNVLLEELDAALDELPAEQREAFVENEFLGRSFQEMAARTGLSVNTLLAHKRYAVLFVAALIALLGWAVMGLWNRLMPGLFGLHVLGFWQAVGLLILCRILLGGHRRGAGQGLGRRFRMFRALDGMTHEEQERFLQGIRAGGAEGH